MDINRLIRVQPDCRGIQGTDSGDVTLERYGDSNRNTMHFCVNGIVASHEMGDWDSSGVVIVANPAQITAPMSGSRLEDTWYHCGNDGKLHLGDATIFVPEGMPVPDGMNVVRYPEGQRNQTVHQHLESLGIKPNSIGRNGVADLDFTDYLNTSKAIGQLYGNGGPSTVSSHMDSLDSKLEDEIGMLDGVLNRMEQGEAITVRTSGGDSEATDYVMERASTFRENLAKHLTENPSLATYASGYYNSIAKQLTGLEARSAELADRYEKRFGIKDSMQQLTGEGLTLKKVSDLIKKFDADPEMLKMTLTQSWPGLQPGEENIGTLDKVFEREIRAFKRVQPQEKPSIVPPPLENKAVPPPIGADLPKDGVYIGTVVAIEDCHVIQKTAPNIFKAHPQGQFPVLPEIGKMLSVTVRNGQTLLNNEKQITQERGGR